MITLRPFQPDDFDAFLDLASDYQVVKMTGSYPWPAQPVFVYQALRTEAARAAHVLAVDFQGEFAGTIRLVKGELGYCLRRKFWGQGIATRAVDKILRRHFADPNPDPGTASVVAGVWADNGASARVLKKSGFEFTHRINAYGRARDRIMITDRFALDRARWAAASPLQIETARLQISPLSAQDAVPLSALMNDVSIARMMASIPHPFPAALAADWIAARQWAGAPGFAAGIRLHDGSLIGWIGFGGAPASIAYALGQNHWGRGYACEAVAAFMPELAARFNPDYVTAGAFADNPASQHVLERCGFTQDGEKQHIASGRVEPARLLLYRWAPTRIGALHEIS